jgi:type I restriction enzyme M protein
MAGSVRTETETVIKRILPYLQRRGYDVQTDLDFETGVQLLDRYNKGYVDVLVTCGKPQPQFLIEAKKTSKKLSEADRKQAIGYGRGLGVPFVVITNGSDIQACNVVTGGPIAWDGRPLPTNKIPTKAQRTKVLTFLRLHKDAKDVPLGEDTTLPFRPGLPLKQLNALFARCHNTIRNIEKNEERAFADFSKLLFLKLLEEKHDAPGAPPLAYSYRFHELADKADAQADQVKSAVLSMLKDVREMGFGDVLSGSMHLSKAKTFHYIVKQLAAVSFGDSAVDTKGAAFEYFVRATLNGKKLGQYFTPRPLVELMASMVGRDTVVNAVLSSTPTRVLDPACGTGGFLVFLMKDAIAQLDKKLRERAINSRTHSKAVSTIMADVFHGADANDGVASAAKMNMVIAGDGHTNIKAEDSLRASASVWSFTEPAYDLIMTNPPFGTSEKASIPDTELAGYDVRTTRGQLLFLQRMIKATVDGGRICTVIDEGVLNNENEATIKVRRLLLTHCYLEAVVRLPEETFKANKINLRSSVLLLKRRKDADENLADNYPIVFCDLQSLGYEGSGVQIRGFDFKKLLHDFDTGSVFDHLTPKRSGYRWTAFDVPSQDVFSEATCRLDLKYWEPTVRERMAALMASGSPTIEALNTIETGRGKSPSVDSYVHAADGYALVVKAGTSISKIGTFVIEDNADWIEKATYEEYVSARKKTADRADKKANDENRTRKPTIGAIAKNDVLLASTGAGTLGKACVFDGDVPAIADGHVTVVRVDPRVVDPAFLADYLRCGFGQDQIQRLFTGSTGLIELTAEHVRRIVVELPGDIKKQRQLSSALRAAEAKSAKEVDAADRALTEARERFRR